MIDPLDPVQSFEGLRTKELLGPFYRTLRSCDVPNVLYYLYFENQGLNSLSFVKFYNPKKIKHLLKSNF